MVERMKCKNNQNVIDISVKSMDYGVTNVNSYSLYTTSPSSVFINLGIKITGWGKI